MGPVGGPLSARAPRRGLRAAEGDRVRRGRPERPLRLQADRLVVDRDGSLFVADWADGQRPNAGAVDGFTRFATLDKPRQASNGIRVCVRLAKLDAESYLARLDARRAGGRLRGKAGLAAVADALAKEKLGLRGRLHAIWGLAKLDGPAAMEKSLASRKPIRIRASDPRHRRSRRSGAHVTIMFRRTGRAVAKRVAALAMGQDPRVQLETFITLARWPRPALPIGSVTTCRSTNLRRAVRADDAASRRGQLACCPEIP